MMIYSLTQSLANIRPKLGWTRMGTILTSPPRIPHAMSCSLNCVQFLQMSSCESKILVRRALSVRFQSTVIPNFDRLTFIRRSTAPDYYFILTGSHSLMSMGHLCAASCWPQVSLLFTCLNKKFGYGFASGLKWLQMTSPAVPPLNLAVNARRMRKVLIDCGHYYGLSPLRPLTPRGALYMGSSFILREPRL